MQSPGKSSGIGVSIDLMRVDVNPTVPNTVTYQMTTPQTVDTHATKAKCRNPDPRSFTIPGTSPPPQTFTCGPVTMGSFAQQPSLPCKLALLPSSGTNNAAHTSPSPPHQWPDPSQIPALTESSSLEN